MKKASDVILADHGCRRRNLHRGAEPLQDTISDNKAIPASSSLRHAILDQSITCASKSGSVSGNVGPQLGAPVDQQPEAATEAGTLQSSVKKSLLNQDKLQRQRFQDPDTGQLAGAVTMTSIDPGTPALETSALPNSHASIPDTTAAHSPDRPLPGHETAHTFLRDANFTLERSQSKSASRITAVIRRLGSVPSPQVKANADTIRNTVIALIGLAASEPRVDAAMFLMAYSKSVLRHQKLLSALRSDGRYNRAIDALIFDPLHRTATSLPTTGAYSFDGNGAAEIGVGRENSDTRAKADTAGAADADDLSSVLDKPQQQAQQQPPRIFQNPSTFSQALAALVRLHLCPPAFWEAIVVWGVPCMNGREVSTLPALSSGGPTQHNDAGSFAAAASEEPHAAGAPQRPDWERKNAAIAVTVTEMLGLRFANPRPAEGLDARPAVRQAWRLPALPPPDAVREVEAYAAGVVQQLSGEEVARVIYNFGQAQLRPQSDVLCVLEERALSHAAAMSVRSISLLLGGYVGMRVRPGPLLEDVMTRRLDQVADGMSIHPLSVVLLQTAKLGATLPEATFAACVARMHSLFEGAAFDTKKFAPRLLWACAVYTTVHGPGVARQAQLEAASWALVRAFAELWEAGRLGCERDGTTILRQAHRSIEVLSREHGWTIGEGTAVSRFTQQCRRVAQQYAARQAEAAQVHGMRLGIFQQTQRICGDRCRVSQKVLWGDGAHFSYIVVDTGEKWIAVELEVSGSVVCNTAGDAIGVAAKPLLRNWALRRWGGEAVSIVEQEWDEATVLSASFADCLRAELSARGAPV